MKNYHDNEDLRIFSVKRGDFGEEVTSVSENEDSASIIKLLNFILSDSIRNRATDIHIEPHEESIIVWERIDGELKETISFPKDILDPLIVRIKIIVLLDITEKRGMQDGRAKIEIDGRDVNLRISIVPTISGEKAEFRILDPKQAKVQLDMIGFGKEDLEDFTVVLSQNEGIVLVTGPTGSGKSSTLYAGINEIKGGTRH